MGSEAIAAIETRFAHESPLDLVLMDVRMPVMDSIARGASNREIAQELFIAEKTVRNHVTNILSRLNLRDRTQAAISAHAYFSGIQDSQWKG